jgi:hypothetical protein
MPNPFLMDMLSVEFRGKEKFEMGCSGMERRRGDVAFRIRACRPFGCPGLIISQHLGFRKRREGNQTTIVRR